MKKVISVLLAVLMLFSVMAVSAAAEDIAVEGTCRCMDHVAVAGKCHCCVYCPTIDLSYLTSCAKKDTNGNGFDGSLCCYNCDGIFPCDCGCDCCKGGADDENDSIFGDIWDEDAQNSFVDAFQKILKQISDVFDRIFNAIFEFLRIDGVLGND